MMLRPKGKDFRVSLGDRGEMIAWSFLLDQGYKIIEKNYRSPLGEIDVIARKSGRLVFVEVKTRSSDRFGNPEEAVGPAKQRKLVQLAQFYLKQNQIVETPCAFAVVSIIYKKETAPQIKIFENAFDAGGEA